VAAVFVGVLAGACNAPPTAPDSLTSDCSPVGQNRFVRDNLRDIYYWYRNVGNANPAAYPSPEDYLDALRYRPLDTSFSFIAGQAADTAFFSESQFIGFGFSSQLLANDDLRVSDVFASSPAAEAGLERGARFLEISGRTVADVVGRGDLGSIFGRSEVGVAVSIRFRDRRGVEKSATMVKRVVTIPTVSYTATYPVAGRTVGYIVFRNFVTPSSAALDAAFAQLKAAGANELVLDLRYNGGGLVSVAQHLAGLIGGSRTRDQIFVQFIHNDRYSARNFAYGFAEPPSALGLERLFVITTRASASASELVINGLRPYLRVVVVGDNTFGKPVGQYSFTFCDKVLHPVSFSTQNARGEGDYFSGLVPDCRAADDLTHAFGDPAEASLAQALGFVQSGQCTLRLVSQADTQARGRPAEPLQPHRENGWQQLVGAY
jgi:carboxyl-terminal processing protease